jgi:hypothetical protein
MPPCTTQAIVNTITTMAWAAARIGLARKGPAAISKVHVHPNAAASSSPETHTVNTSAAEGASGRRPK